MTQTLPRVAHEHHERLTQHVDAMPAVADRLLTASAEEIRAAAFDLGSFVTGTFVPHMESVERTLYPELERLLQNRHSMAPMRHEHEELRRLAKEFAKAAETLATGSAGIGKVMGLRRVMFRLYALAKVHLAEEEAYLRIVSHGQSAEAGELMAAALAHPVAD